MRVLAVDLGGSHVTCGVLDDQRLLESFDIRSDGGGNLVALLPVLAEKLRDLRDRTGGAFDGIGFGFCGLVDTATTRVLSTNLKYADATCLDLTAWSREALGLPLILENDARMALLGEQHAGAARNAEDVVMMTLGTGIGTAVMMGGRLMRGRHSQAGCLGGHFTVRPNGRPCSCGARGCFEAEASSHALPEICFAWENFQTSLLAQEKELNFKTLFRCADAGDPVAVQVREHCMRIWEACGLSLIHAYDPDLLVVGGGVAKSTYPVVDRIRHHINSCAWTPWGKVTVVAASLGHEAALFGAVPLFQEQP